MSLDNPASNQKIFGQYFFSSNPEAPDRTFGFLLDAMCGSQCREVDQCIRHSKTCSSQRRNNRACSDNEQEISEDTHRTTHKYGGCRCEYDI